MAKINICKLNKDCSSKLKEFLIKVDCDFPIPLSQKTNPDVLSHKLSDNGLLMAVTDGSDILSGCFGYANDSKSKVAYISIVATLKEYRGMGLAEKCVRAFLDEAKKQNMESAVLYTHNTNHGAIKLYEKMGFTEIASDRDGDVKMKFILKQSSRNLLHKYLSFNLSEPISCQFIQ